MKKKLALLCMAGVMIVGMSACNGKKSDQETSETSSTVSEEESTDSEESTGRVRDRKDYVGLQDLNIDEYVTLTDYKNMKVSAIKPEVLDEGIIQYINSELLRGNITNRAVREGDIADIDFEGKKDGVAFQGGTAAGYKLGIGTGSFIPGFEEGLVGVMPGETVDLNLTFPEDYEPNPDLAGQEVVFTVTVNGIEYSAEYETVTPEDMKNLGLPYETKEELWEAGKKGIEESAEESFAANSKMAILQKLVDESTVESIPEYLVEEEAENYNLYIESLAMAMYNMDLATFVNTAYGVTLEEYNSQMSEMFTDTVKQYMVLEAVARAEGIEVTEDMIRDKADEEAPDYGYGSGDELIDGVGYTTYRMSIVQDKTMERLMEIVTVEEEKTQEAEES
ncbi:MAG: trigger factor [Lachnospiraceae bacterium]|nr:trigger factor [Lachnospiraceae bacterium]